MITGFEEYTADLNDDEKRLAESMAKGFANRIGKSQSITNHEIISAMKANKGITLKEAKVRKLVNYIRRAGLVPCLIASSSGYYVSQDAEEIREYIRSLSERAGAIDAVAKVMERQLNELTKDKHE